MIRPAWKAGGQSVSLIYAVNHKKVPTIFFVHIFGKYLPIFATLSLAHSADNLR